MDQPLEVRYAATGAGYQPVSGSILIPTGARSAQVDIQPLKSGTGAQLAALTAEPGSAYHIGCPRSALVAIVDGPPPQPVDIRKVDSNGGETEADRKWFAETMKEHKAWKKVKKPNQ